MDNPIEPLSSECLWYYLIVVAAGLIIAWAVIPIGGFGDSASKLQVWGFTTPVGNV